MVTSSIDREDILALVSACAWPSEAFWRCIELAAVRQIRLETPILEIGCGDGAFTELTGAVVEEAVDTNARAVIRARRRPRVYRSVHHGDVRDLAPRRPAAFATVFANSVLEHIKGISPVLAACHDVLRPGGQLVTTLPLKEMEAHLAVSHERYARARSRQLRHRNLLHPHEWDEQFERAGFSQSVWIPYLAPADCRRWDVVDAIGSAGISRYRIATATRALVQRLPARVGRNYRHFLGRRIYSLPFGRQVRLQDACAALAVVTKRGETPYEPEAGQCMSFI